MHTTKPSQPAFKKGTYRHNKTGNLYRALGLALDTEHEGIWLVVYAPLYESDVEYFARPYDMFTGYVELGGKTVPRFEKISDV